MTTDRTDRRLGIAIAIVSLIGLGIAAYLTYVHYAHKQILCLTNGGCEVVQSSRYAKFAGIPVPVLGIFGYTSLLISLVIPGDIGRGLGALLGVSGFGFSVYLTWLEIARINALCQWCLGSATMMTIIAALTVTRLWRYQPYAAVPASPGADDAAEPEPESADSAEPATET